MVQQRGALEHCAGVHQITIGVPNVFDLNLHFVPRPSPDICSSVHKIELHLDRYRPLKGGGALSAAPAPTKQTAPLSP